MSLPRTPVLFVTLTHVLTISGSSSLSAPLSLFEKLETGVHGRLFCNVMSLASWTLSSALRIVWQSLQAKAGEMKILSTSTITVVALNQFVLQCSFLTTCAGSVLLQNFLIDGRLF